MMAAGSKTRCNSSTLSLEQIYHGFGGQTLLALSITPFPPAEQLRGVLPESSQVLKYSR